jgi:5-(carboxyamino)imidazole ribonucleotide synthase
MINILGEDTLPQELMAIESLSIHWYGKDKRPGRKMGHINVSGNTDAKLDQRLKAAAGLLSEEAFSDIKHYIANR